MLFELGDVVMLQSGGPKMTVSNIMKGGTIQTTIKCQWFVNEAAGWTLMDGFFSPDSLVIPPNSEAMQRVSDTARGLLAKGDALASKWLGSGKNSGY